jgi:hypothetical protein
VTPTVFYSHNTLVPTRSGCVPKESTCIVIQAGVAHAARIRGEGMSIRNDNRSQFIAQAVREYLKEKGVYKEFSHVATPEDNAYIEAFNSNLQREVVDGYEFDSICHARMILDRYYQCYNEKRRHGALNRQTPNHVFKNINPVPFENEKLLNYL